MTNNTPSQEPLIDHLAKQRRDVRHKNQIEERPSEPAQDFTKFDLSDKSWIAESNNPVKKPAENPEPLKLVRTDEDGPLEDTLTLAQRMKEAILRALGK